jgi:hypothetical protein
LAARENGTARISLSLPPTRTLLTPYCKRTRPGRRTTRRPQVPPFACLLLSPLRAPSRADPSGLGHAATIYSSVQGSPGVETPTNSYQTSLKMSPFEALYGRKCRTPLYWDQTGERQFFGPEIIQEAEEQAAQLIRENLRTAQSRQKSYADTQRRLVEFKEGDHMYFKVSPIRGMRRFKVKGKLSPRFIGPFLILKRVGKLPINWNYSTILRMYMMSSMYPS